MTLKCSKASCSLFSELPWKLISFGSDAGILKEVSACGCAANRDLFSCYDLSVLPGRASQ